ncbi:hypothetical protein BDF22DRAFT_150134 [Syncephalis plumigaleata]|nr:hypothetical protein BDF22DRAFT_150134 [Syncephalis plumigaleata]
MMSQDDHTADYTTADTGEDTKNGGGGASNNNNNNGNSKYTNSPASTHSRPGDWACPNCQFHNFATRQYCLKCQTPAPAGTSSTPGGRHPDDWTCPNTRCNFLNYASRSQCLRCSTYRPDMSTNTSANTNANTIMPSGYNMLPHNSYSNATNTGNAAMGGAGAAYAHGFRPGDWICPNPNCYFQNFASRTTCYRCHTPNPQSVYDMSSVYGDPNMNGGVYTAYGHPIGVTSSYGAPPPPLPPLPPPPPSTAHGMDGYRGASSYSSYGHYPSYGANLPSNTATVSGGAAFRPGDWYCPGCNSHNFASRLQCMRCQMTRPGGSQAAVAAMLKPGDWICSCGYHNFAKRPQCGKCGRAPDPQQAAQQQEYLQQTAQQSSSGGHAASSGNDYNSPGY